MRQFPFTFSVTTDETNTAPIRTVRAHVEQKSKVTFGLCTYDLNLWINEVEDTREIKRTIPNVRYLETPLDVMAWVIALYPEINTVPQPEPEPKPADPLAELRKEIEAPTQTWRAVFSDQVRENDTVMWMGTERVVKEIIRNKRSAVLEFAFEDSTSYFKIHKSVQLMILSKENETQ